MWNAELRLADASLGAITPTIALALCIAAGCQLPGRRYEPPVDHAQLGDVQFVHYLAAVPTVSVDEGVRAAVMLINEENDANDFDARVDVLERRGAIDRKWVRDPDQTLDMGTLAFMLSAICGVPPSANAAVSNAAGVGRRRYALRACISAELLPYSTQRHAVRGGELVTAMTKCRGDEGG